MTPARYRAEQLFIKEPSVTHWETDLGRKIIEGYVLRCPGLQDARVKHIKDFMVTLQTGATEREINDAELYVRRQTKLDFVLSTAVTV